MNFRKSFVYVLVVILAGCVDFYKLPTITNDLHLLVVDGSINSADGTATVRLTRSKSPSSTEAPMVELNASVSVTSEKGTTYGFNYQDSGTYSVAGLPLHADAQYQLHIQTAGGEEFLSEYITLIKTPAIDSVNWVPNDDGLDIFVNAHDDLGNTRYYEWKYIETWQYHAAFLSQYKLVNQRPVFRSEEEQIDPCWHTVASTKIFLASTTGLNADVIRNYPIISLKKGSDKLSVKYSILVRQRAVSEGEFHYLELLRKTTESLGGLFDPLPTRVLGNIRKVGDDQAPVLGYFSAGSVNETRIFIDFNNLPKPLQVLPLFPGCYYDTVCLVRPKVSQYNGGCQKDLQNLSASDMILTDILDSMGVLVGYTKTVPECSDCRYQGGTLTKPSFWK